MKSRRLSAGLSFLAAALLLAAVYPAGKARIVSACRHIPRDPAARLHPVPDVRRLYLSLWQAPIAAAVLVAGAAGMGLLAPIRWASGLERLLRRARRIRPSVCVPALAALTIAGACVVQRTVYRGIPADRDTVALLWQAKVFASGRLSVPAPPCQEAFDVSNARYPCSFTVHGPRWFTVYCPGHPALLALGVLVGCPWIVNPLQTGLSVVLVYVVGRKLYGGSRAALAAGLFVLSPFVLFMGASMSTHVTAMLSLLVVAWACLKDAEADSLRWALLGGSALGFALLTRPLTALGVGIPCALWLAIHGRRSPGRAARHAAAWAIAAAPFVAVLLAYNAAQTGDAFLAPYTLFDPRNRLGFGDVGTWATYGSMGHTPWKALLNTVHHLVLLNRELLGWPSLSLVPAVLCLVIRPRRADVFCAMVAAGVILAYAVFWAYDDTFGPRYYYSSVPVLLLLSASGLYKLHGLILRRVRTRCPTVRRRAAVAVAGSVFVLTLGSTPRWCAHRIRFYRSWGHGMAVHDVLTDTVAKAGIGKALVFVDDTGFYFGNGFLHNSPDFEDRVLFARRRGPELDRRTAAAWPGRDPYVFHYLPDLRRGRLRPLDRAKAACGPPGPRAEAPGPSATDRGDADDG